MKELRKNKIRFKYVHGNIRGYRNEKKKPAVSEAQFMGIDGVAQALTVGNIPKIYGIEEWNH